MMTFLIRSRRTTPTMFLMFPPILLLTFFRTIRNFLTSRAFISLLLPTYPASRLQLFNIRIVIYRLRISKNSHFLLLSFRNQIPQRSCWFNVRGGEEWRNRMRVTWGSNTFQVPADTTEKSIATFPLPQEQIDCFPLSRETGIVDKYSHDGVCSQLRQRSTIEGRAERHHFISSSLTVILTAASVLWSDSRSAWTGKTYASAMILWELKSW